MAGRAARELADKLMEIHVLLCDADRDGNDVMCDCHMLLLADQTGFTTFPELRSSDTE